MWCLWFPSFSHVGDLTSCHPATYNLPPLATWRLYQKQIDIILIKQNVHLPFLIDGILLQLNSSCTSRPILSLSPDDADPVERRETLAKKRPGICPMLCETLVSLYSWNWRILHVTSGQPTSFNRICMVTYLSVRIIPLGMFIRNPQKSSHWIQEEMQKVPYNSSVFAWWLRIVLVISSSGNPLNCANQL